MDLARKILFNMAIRLRKAKRNHNIAMKVTGYGSHAEIMTLGELLEANNSFQAAKQIYYESK